MPARLRVDNVPLTDALTELHRHSGVRLAFSPSLLSDTRKVTCHCEAVTVGEALRSILRGTAFSYVELGGHVLIEPRQPEQRSAIYLAQSLGLSIAPAAAMMAPSAPSVLLPAAASPRDGRLIGRVVAARSLAPMGQVQISLAGTELGTLTQSDGRFILANVPAGTYELRVERIGYRSVTREVVVTDGETTSVEISLDEEALSLDEIVVTGTAGQARRREVGNSITQINLAEVKEPVIGIEQLLQSRAAGIIVTEGNGSIGSGAQIRLRGSVSVSQSNAPLIYIDGIRVKSDAYRKNVPPTGNDGRSGNVTASPLADINPADIERIEVIKGSAATTLYGTEAAAGVLQIFTKRGRSGAPQWTMQVDQGVNHLRSFAPASNPYLNMEPFLRDGRRQRYSMSVSGGGQALQYFASSLYENNEGVLPDDEEEKVGVRGNFTFTPLRDLQIMWNTSYTRDQLRNTPSGNNAQGLTLNAYRAERNYFGANDPELLRQLLDQEIRTWLDRFITGATASYSPTSNFTNRLTIGYDRAQQENRNLRPYGFLPAPQGIMSDQQYNNVTLTLDYAGSYRLGLSEDLAATLAFGGQSVTNEQITTSAYGEGFPGPGSPTVSSAAQTLGFEERLRVINAGFFGQALVDFRDRYFLTLGVRVDGNSAFGESLGLQAYPKASVSYVVSDESFWPDGLGQVKLRAAYGQSGRAPGAFDAVRTWDPVGYGGQPAFFPRNLGNPDLGPERTAETEIGFDGAFLSDRLITEFTYYHQKTSDALFQVRQAPSEGFASSQLRNVGVLRNSGIELSLTGTLIDRASFGWILGGSLYTNDSEVLDLGGAPEFAAGNGWIAEGQPIMALRGTLIRNADEKAAPVVERDHVYGPQQPTHVLGFISSLRFPRGIELSARGEYQGGHYINDGATQNAVQRAVRWPTCSAAYALIDAGQLDDLTALQRKRCIQQNYESGLFVYPKDFFKLREVTLQVPIGFALPSARSATLTLSGRNWLTWKNRDFEIFDPEMIGDAGHGAQNGAISEHIPPPAVFIASVRVVF
jgi:outer membrane receptor protein involved in Fe transport